MIPLEYDREGLTGWKCTKGVFLLFVVTLPFFFITPDMLPITPGTVQETRECYLKTSSLQGVPENLLIDRHHCSAFAFFLLESPRGQSSHHPHDFFPAYSTSLFFNLLMSIFLTQGIFPNQQSAWLQLYVYLCEFLIDCELGIKEFCTFLQYILMFKIF